VLVHRFDVATLGNAERTPQGFLRIPAYLTRVGVLEYRRADGQVVRELRPRDEVFRAQSLATLSAAPVTDLHPTRMVSPDNVRELSVGHVSDHVKADGNLVSAHVTIQEAKAIAAVERGERRELSCGYACRIDETPGVYEGESYDQVQRDITYNHVAIGPRNWGRAGRDVALRVDAADGGASDASDVFRLDTADALSVAITAPLDDDDDGGNMDLVTIRVDGIDVQVTKQAAQVIEKALATRDDALAEVTSTSETLQGRLDAALGESKKDKAALAAATDPVRLDAQLSERFALVETAKRVLPPEHKYDGQSTRQIQEAVLLHLDSSADLKERTDEYIAARFDGVMSTQAERVSNLDDARRITAPPTRTPRARADAREPVIPDWQRPLSFTKKRNTAL
jgi:uncharacterized protein